MTPAGTRSLTRLQKRLRTEWRVLTGVLATLVLFMAGDALLLHWTGDHGALAGILAVLLMAWVLWHGRRQASALQHAVSCLDQAAQAQQEIRRVLSHDMRSPQSTILSVIELRRRVPGRWPEDAVLEQIEQQARITLDLVDDAVQLARTQSAALNRHPCHLDDLIQECCDRRWSQAESRGITLDFDARHPQAVLMIDADLMGRAIGKLLDHVLLHQAADTCVTCRLERDGALWRIHVQHAGPDTSSQQPAIQGLGLAFVQAVAHSHGGQFSGTHTPEHGRCFTISIPAADI